MDGERAEPSATATADDSDTERAREGRGRLDGMEWVLAPSIDRLNYIAPVDGPVASTPWFVTLLKLGLGGD